MYKRFLTRLKNDRRKNLHLIFIGTKPDIIKQAPVYHELLRRGELVAVIHTGQHYDFRNSKAILDELDITVDINYCRLIYDLGLPEYKSWDWIKFQ